MNNEIKMSDVFGRVIADADTLIAHGYGVLADFSGYKRECRYVAHAINNHDRLVEENNELKKERDFLTETIDQLSDHVCESELSASGISVKYDNVVEENKRLRSFLKGTVIEFDSDYLDGDAYGLMCGIKQLLSELDGEK